MSILQRGLQPFKEECKSQEQNLLCGKCQLCIDSLLLMVVLPNIPSNEIDEITPNPRCPLILYGDDYLLRLVSKCPSIKIIHPRGRPFQGWLDLSLFQSCTSLELIRIPFNRIYGTKQLRPILQSLTWKRGSCEITSNESIRSLFLEGESSETSKPLRVDEIFWDQFGVWPSLTYLSISGSNIMMMNASTIPSSIKILNLRCNRLGHFNNLANYSITSTITKLFLEYNSMKELPRLNANTLSNLTHLSLRGNLLVSIIGLRDFSLLSYLNLAENSISSTTEFLSEIVYLSSTLKTLIVEKNPISHDSHLQSKCESVLYKMENFNGKNVKPKSPNNQPMPPIVLNTSLPPDSSGLEDSIESQGLEKVKKLKKSKPSKERFVVINDELNENTFDGSRIIPKIIEKRNETKNYFFGGYSGSYGSSYQIKNETLPQNVHGEKEEPKIPTKVEDAPIHLEAAQEADVDVSRPEIKETQIETWQEYSEWAIEDTEENTMFLVEIYSSSVDFEQYLCSKQDNEYYFIRIRQRDGLIFEKDCLSGKVLQTLDLKILEHYKTLPNDLAIKLYFDTIIQAKKERIYRFLDEKSFNCFVEMFLSKYAEYRNKFESTSEVNQNENLTKNSSKKFASPWYYMCLRCGERTHRIITDCSKCGSDLIIRDESLQSESNNNLEKGNVEKASFVPQSEITIVNNEETIDNELLPCDENFFRTNIDHYLKLHIEIYLYERIDESFKSESVEALFNCCVYDFIKKSFVPALAVLTTNYFFLFHHSVPNSSESTNEELTVLPKKSSIYGSLNKKKDNKDMISLIFYSPLASKESSSLVISHLPKPMKNIGYWIEAKLDNSQRKMILNLTKNKIKRKFILELVLFPDETMGKAFLEILFKFQKKCINPAKNDNSIKQDSDNLIIVKSSITKFIDGGGDDLFRIVFDENCALFLEQATSAIEPNTNDNKIILPIFIIESFHFSQNVPVTKNSPSFNNIFTIDENIILLIENGYLIIAELYCQFTKISPSTKSTWNKNETIADVLKDSDNFQDHIAIKTLFKEWIINLLPNIFIDKTKFILVLRFREDEDSLPTRNVEKHQLNFKEKISLQKPKENVSSNHQITISNHDLTIYEFKLRFLSLNSLIHTCKIICSSWEQNFGVSLTLSKYHENS